MADDPEFLKPTAVERVFNQAFGWLLRFGIGLSHNYVLEVRGRKTGRVYSTPVDVLDFGGRLVYATCSLECEENEGVVERVLAESPEYQLVSRTELVSAQPTLSPLFDPEGYLRTRPDLHNMDGFFAAVIQRKT
jgi:hypothetical protein